MTSATLAGRPPPGPPPTAVSGHLDIRSPAPRTTGCWPVRQRDLGTGSQTGPGPILELAPVVVKNSSSAPAADGIHCWAVHAAERLVEEVGRTRRLPGSSSSTLHVSGGGAKEATTRCFSSTAPNAQRLTSRADLRTFVRSCGNCRAVQATRSTSTHRGDLQGQPDRRITPLRERDPEPSTIVGITSKKMIPCRNIGTTRRQPTTNGTGGNGPYCKYGRRTSRTSKPHGDGGRTKIPHDASHGRSGRTQPTHAVDACEPCSASSLEPFTSVNPSFAARRIGRCWRSGGEHHSSPGRSRRTSRGRRDASRRTESPRPAKQ